MSICCYSHHVTAPHAVLCCAGKRGGLLIAGE